MILADSSVWIDHLRRAQPELIALLSQGRIAVHPFVLGELACGHLQRREVFLTELGRLPAAPQATHDEVLHIVDQHALFGRGIGWVDAHLLASAALMPNGQLWTRDRRLATMAIELGLSWTENRH